MLYSSTQPIMKRTVALLLPLIALAVAAPEGSERKSREETIGMLWQESVNSEDDEAGLEKLTAFVKAGGDSYMGNLRAAYLNYTAQKYDEATRFYLAAAKLQPNAMSPRLGLLNIAKTKGDEAAAAAAGAEVLRIELTHYSALMAVAWNAFQTKNFPLARRTYESVLAIYPEDMDAMSGAAWSAFHTGRKVDAKQGFRRLMSLNPDYAFVRQGIAATSR